MNLLIKGKTEVCEKVLELSSSQNPIIIWKKEGTVHNLSKEEIH